MGGTDPTGFLLDTNVVSARLRGHGRVCVKFVRHGGRLFISAVTPAEAAVRPKPNRTRAKQADVDALPPELVVLPLDEPVAPRFAEVSAGLRNAGTPLPTADLLIAATALHHDLTAVTANRRRFGPAPGLAVEGWTTA